MNKLITLLVLLIVLCPKIVDLFGEDSYIPMFVLLIGGFISIIILILYKALTNPKPYNFSLSWYRKRY